MKPSKFKLIEAARGFSLVELMVAMAIGLILLLALSYFFLGSRQSSLVHDDSSRMQENARNALDLMGRSIRQAGYTDRFDRTQKTVFVVMSGVDNGATVPDAITVRYEGQVGGESDCAGTARAEGGLVTFAFAVNGSLQLTCDNGSGAPVVIADNVENMQITYGLDTLRNGKVALPYIDQPSATQFPQVAVVKVVLTMRGANANAATGGDGYVRQTYSASYTVRNQAG